MISKEESGVTKMKEELEDDSTGEVAEHKMMKMECQNKDEANAVDDGRLCAKTEIDSSSSSTRASARSQASNEESKGRSGESTRSSAALSASSGESKGSSGLPKLRSDEANDEVDLELMREGDFEDVDLKLIHGDGVSKYSLDLQTMPKGTLFQALKRIRGTVNRYAADTAKIDWQQAVKMLTNLALDRRLRNHKHELHGTIDADIEIGYTDICVRLHSLIDLFRKMKAWIDTGEDARLAAVVAPLDVLQRY